MSLRTQRNLGVWVSLLFVAAACTATPPATPGASPTEPGATAPPATPTEPGATAPPATPTPEGTEPPPDGGLAADQTFHLYLASEDPPTLDPNAAEDSVSISVIGALHRGLMYWDAELGTVPALAASEPEITNDGATMTFTLRDDAVYSDGSPIVAGDLVFSWRRLVDPRLANPYAYLLCFVEGVDQLLEDCGALDEAAPEDEIDARLEEVGVEAPDESTFIVNLSSPATFFLAITAMWPVVPLKQEWVETPNFQEPENYISSGPYIITTWSHQSLIVLEPNPNWYGEQQPTVTLEMNIGGDPDAALAAYEQGNLDTVPVPPTQFRRVEADPLLSQELIRLPQLGITYYGFATCQRPEEACPTNPNTSDGRSPAANQNFRIALTQAVDKQRFIDLTFAGNGIPANSIVMPGIPGHDPDFNPYPFDLDAANERMNTALEELGVEDGPDEGEDVTAADLGTIRIGYNTNAGHLPRVVFLAEAWRNAFGMTEDQFDLVGVDFSTLLQERTRGTYDVSRNGWGADFPHAHNQLSDLFRCLGGNNDEQWCNEEFDRLIDEGAAEQDPVRQEQLYIDAQRIMLEEAAALPLVWPETPYLVKPWVQGLQSTSSDHQNTGDVFYETIQILEH
jgi:oligopeptide transport system substrate-binding protein